MPEQALIADELRFAEALRWHDGRLWFSDVHDYKLKVVEAGEVRVVAEVPGRPSGLGRLPDGRMLMATALEPKLWTVGPGDEVREVADVGHLTQGLLNDMVVDRRGRAYVGDTGFNLAKGEAPRPGRVILWEEGAEPRVAAEDVVFPNGCVVTPDGRYIVNETLANRISAFAVAEDGSLGDRTIFAETTSAPDGLCLDAEGAVWAALPNEGVFVRVLPDGSIAQQVDAVAPFAVSCVIGGEDARTLFLSSAYTDLQRLGRGDTTGRIDAIEVDVPGGGSP